MSSCNETKKHEKKGERARVAARSSIGGFPGGDFDRTRGGEAFADAGEERAPVPNDDHHVPGNDEEVRGPCANRTGTPPLAFSWRGI